MEKEPDTIFAGAAARCRLTEYDRADYGEVYDLQTRLVDALHAGRMEGNRLLLLEHNSVYTLGKRGGRENLVVSEAFLAEKGIEIVQIERGGNITYHGPGQLVAYPIVDLGRGKVGVETYVTGLEEVMIRCAAKLGVDALRDPKNHGVWVGGNKVGSVGIAIRRGIAFHGLALNVNLSLDPFTWINPCGLTGVGMTSVARELGEAVSMAEARARMLEAFTEVFGFSYEEGDAAALPIEEE